MNFVNLFSFFGLIIVYLIKNSATCDLAERSKDENNDKATSAQRIDFQKPIYIINEEKEKLKKGYKIPFDIKMNQDITGKIKLTLDDAQKSDLAHYFETTHEKDKITVHLKDDILPENLKSFNTIVFLLKFVKDTSEEDNIHSTLIIFLQDKAPQSPKSIAFEKSKYEINLFAEYVGLVEQFVAKLDTSDSKSVITYNLITEDAILKESLQLKEPGIMKVTKSLPPNTYNFKIAAKISDEIRTEAEVVVRVNHMFVCDSKTPKFQYSQLVKHVAEGKPEVILDAMKPVEKCLYKIVSQEPKGEYFELDEKTGGLKLKEVKVDKTVFQDTENPNFILKLSVTCDGSETKNDEAIQTSNIPYNPNEMILIVMIDRAIFSVDTIFLGYPKDYDTILHYAPSLKQSILPYTRQRDDIWFSIAEEDSLFSIHPATGAIYPLNFYNKDEDHMFNVLARDSKNNTVGKLSVTMKFLKTSQLVEIFFVDPTLIYFDDILRDYSKQVGIDIKSIAHEAIPITDEQRKANKIPADDKHTHLVKAICFALGAKQKIVEGGEIVKKVKPLPNIFSIEVVTDKASPSCPDVKNESHSITLTSIIVAVILALGVIISVMYLLIRRKNPVLIIKRRTPARSSVTPLEDDMEAPSRTRWINSRVNVYNKYDQMSENVFTNPSFDRTRRVSYSNNNGEVVIMDNTKQTPNDLLSSGVSSFKPDTINENPSSEDVTNVYRDLVLPSASGVNSDVPVLAVTSLPPMSAHSRRRKTDGDI